MLLKNKRTLAIVTALTGAILFSSKAVMVKLTYNYEVDKLTLLLLRMGFALPIYIFIAFKNPRHGEHTPLTFKDWILLVLLGIIGYYFASFLDFWGLQYISASLERLILFVYPTITTILAGIIFKRSITWKQIGAIILSYIGICIAFADKIFGTTQEDFWEGALLIFLSALTFSFYLVGSEKLIPKFGAKRFTSYCMIVSCIAVLIHFSLAGNVEFNNLPNEVYWLGLAIAIFNTVLPSYMMSSAIRVIGASTTAILSSVGPISVLILAYFVLNEPIEWLQVYGTVIVIGGVLLISKKP